SQRDWSSDVCSSDLSGSISQIFSWHVIIYLKTLFLYLHLRFNILIRDRLHIAIDLSNIFPIYFRTYNSGKSGFICEGIAHTMHLTDRGNLHFLQRCSRLCSTSPVVYIGLKLLTLPISRNYLKIITGSP